MHVYFADKFIQVNWAVLKESTQQKLWRKNAITGKPVSKEFCEYTTLLNLLTHFFFYDMNIRTLKNTHTLTQTHMKSRPIIKGV